jgi:hypothetical protein
MRGEWYQVRFALPSASGDVLATIGKTWYVNVKQEGAAVASQSAVNHFQDARPNETTGQYDRI